VHRRAPWQRSRDPWAPDLTDMGVRSCWTERKRGEAAREGRAGWRREKAGPGSRRGSTIRRGGVGPGGDGWWTGGGEVEREMGLWGEMAVRAVTPSGLGPRRGGFFGRVQPGRGAKLVSRFSPGPG
jgi:hypothetical protein